MFNYKPANYVCPLCLAAHKIENENTLVMINDVFYKDDLIFAMINSKFIGNNPGHVIIAPNEHYENIFDIPRTISHRVFDVSKKIAIAMKEIQNCDGIMIRQNNGPASGQHAFHYHLHIIPRFTDDELESQMTNSRVAKPSERSILSNAFKKYFDSQPIVP